MIRRSAVRIILGLGLLAAVRPAAGQTSSFLLAYTPADSLAVRPLGKILIEGNETSDDHLILRTAGLPEKGPATPYRLRTAVRALYGLGLFSSVTVQDWPDSSGRRGLTLILAENPRVASLGWKGNRKLSEDDLKGKIDLKAGQLLTRKKLFEAQRAVEAAYRDEGYASAQVMPESSAPNQGTVDLVFNVDEGSKVSIVAVDFQGNHSFPAQKLRGKAVLRVNSLFHGKRFTSERLREDGEKLTGFYRDNGFKDALVTPQEPVFSADRKKVSLGYHVEEGPLYRFGRVQWQGNTVVSSEQLRKASAIVRGAPFSKAKLDATTAAGYELYTEKGYLLQLSIQPETSVSGDSVNVAYSITEGEPSKVHEVSILGNSRTKERVIRRELTLFPGQLLRRSVLLRSQRDVFALGYFEDVQIDYQPTGEGSDVDVSFTVKEKSSGTATAGVGYSSGTGLTGFVNFGHNNLFGNGWGVNMQLERGGKVATYDVSFTEPWLFQTPTSLSLRIYDTRNEYDIYTEKTRGAGLDLGRPWFFKKPDFSRVYAGYSLENVRYANPIDEKQKEILEAFPQGAASRLSLSFVRNSTNDPFYPTSGSKTTARLELTGGLLGGRLNYYKPLLDHQIYFVPFWVPAVRIRNRLSWLGTYGSGDQIPGGETFRMGGTRTDYLRGYPDYYVVPEENIHLASDGSLLRFPGGKISYIFTAEYGFPIVKPVHGVFFLDAGNTWNTVRDFSLNDLRKGIGAGIRLEIPMLGPVGFDYAYGIDRGRWQAHFIIGPAF